MKQRNKVTEAACSLSNSASRERRSGSTVARALLGIFLVRSELTVARAAWSVSTAIGGRGTQVMLCVSLLLLVARASTVRSAPSFQRVEGDKLFAVTDDRAMNEPGCDSISIFDVRDVHTPLYVSPYAVSPGQLAMSLNGDLLITAANNSAERAHVARRVGDDDDWAMSYLYPDGRNESRTLWGGATAFTLDGEYVLIPTVRGLEKYKSESIGTRDFGSRFGIVSGLFAAAIELSGDGNYAYVVDSESRLSVVRIDRMSLVKGPVLIPSEWTDIRERTRRVYAALSPDERFLLVSQGPVARVAVVDLESMDVSMIDVPGVDETWGLAFNYLERRKQQLAVHGRDRVVLGEFLSESLEFMLQGVVEVPPQRAAAWPFEQHFARMASLAWVGDGEHLVAAIGGWDEDWQLLRRGSGERALIAVTRFYSCNGPRRDDFESMALDVVALNREQSLERLPTATAVPSPDTPTPTTETPVSATSTPLASPTTQATSAATPSPVDTATPPPVFSVALPAVVNGGTCLTRSMPIDVVLIIDASSSMLGGKIEAATRAASVFLEGVDAINDRVAIVSFNAEAITHVGLTSDAAELALALDGIRVSTGTRMDLGLLEAEDALAARRPDSTVAAILLSDGRHDGESADVLKAGRRMIGSGIALYAVGYGDDVDAEMLQSLAERPEQYLFAATPAELEGIYAALAQTLPCLKRIDIGGARSPMSGSYSQGSNNVV